VPTGRDTDMRRWWIVSLISASALMAPIATAAPAHAVCISLFQRCPAPAPTPTTVPPAPPVTSPPPAPVVPPPAASVDPNQAAAEFFDDTNAARADAGVAPLAWRADVADMAVAHSADMAQQGSIWHGSFVTTGTLVALNASSVGENVGMGGGVAQVHEAFLNSPHHRDNILDAVFNQVGIGVIVSGATVYVTEDFLKAKGGQASARPTPVAHPAVKKAAPVRTVSSVAAVPKQTVPPATSPPTSAAPPPQGVVTTTPLDAGSVEAAAAPAKIVPGAAGSHASVAGWAALLGAVLLAGSAAGHVVVSRRRRA
jgi:uncharacterized protein YkwD